MKGVKFDQGKLRYTLVPPRALRLIVEVLEFGAGKYSVGNWAKVPDAKQRYKDALLRHIYAYLEGETIDPESGVHHLAHAACCILFLLELEKRK